MLKTLCSVILLLTAILVGQATSAQNLKKEAKSQYHLHNEKPNFDVIRDNMPSLSCNYVIQDRYGFIWVATENGIVRYDGKKVFSFLSDQKGLDKDNSIKTIEEDSISNYLWGIHSKYQKLIRINLSTYEIKEIPYDINEENRQFSGIVSVCDSLLLGVTRHGFYTVNKENGNTQLIYKCESRPNVVFKRNFFWHRGVLHNISGGDLFTIEHFNGVFDIKKISDKSVGLIFGAHELNDSLLVMSVMRKTNEISIITYNTKTKHNKELTKVHGFYHDICMSDDGIWLVSVKGLLFIRISDNKVFSYSSSNTNLPDNNLQSMIKSTEQPIFFICSTDGLINMNYFSSMFNMTDMRRFSPAEYAQVWSTLKDSNGRIWIGCSDGLYYRQSASELFFTSINIQADKSKSRLFTTMGIVESLEHDEIFFYSRFAIYRTTANNDSELILATESNEKIYGVQPFPNHRLLITTDSEIFSLDYKTNQKTTHYSFRNLNDKTVFSHSSDYKTLWFTESNTELKRLDFATGKTEVECKIDPESGPIFGMRHNIKGGMNELWFFTNHGALFYKLPGYPGLTRIRSSFMKNQAVKSIEVDDLGDVWITTDEGLVRLRGNETKEFTHKEFSLCRKFTIGASSKGANGEIIMGGEYGYVEFHPRNFHINTYFPAPRLSSYQFSNSRNKYYDLIAQEEYVCNIDTINVPAGIRSLQMSVNVLNYDHPNENELEWRMDNENEWKKKKSNSYLHLYNLTEGHHKLYMRSIDGADEPQNKVTTLHIYKEVFFYETRAFYILMAFLVFLTIIGIAAWRNKRFADIKKYLTNELSIKSDMLLLANKEMRDKQEIIRKQNSELANINNNLENLVRERTNELEIERHKAIESSELKSAFLANLGHEIRTPMNAIVGFARLLQMPQCSENERAEFAHLIIESSNNMLNLIGGLLDTSRIERGIIEVSFADFDIYTEILDTWSILNMESRNKNVEFQLDEDEALRGQILCSDKDRFRQILINLTYNAFKFTPRGHVKITARKISPQELPKYNYPTGERQIPVAPKGLLLLFVEDTGIGIAPNQQEAIFEPFRRIANGKKAYGGLGLGLNIVKNLVQLLGGEVWLKSEPEMGSTFYFYLPFDKVEKKEPTGKK